ncbi:Stage II sporulation protein E (SpoIIE) [Quadrisphaera granulorum]|uniref:Stage II sporulation protein E n=1 Tax=Quadrisphaera granulorum TaxID=317664 RepID=A0A316ABL0_9ACTN|nr:PP2C family protein-serine/threonine phosphatase [Quadrisphaera granulorum]PWJ54638.1 stage II sporulation protein E [Quadrisphaera granulorum]SZE96000.1 Stage II sporulation protein E (SpoIIE) [Quadrisphaera granulorum]
MDERVGDGGTGASLVTGGATVDTDDHVLLRPTTRWLWLGLAACAGLAVTDLVSGEISGDPGAANLGGTFALAPTLTAIGGARWHVLLVGVLAVTTALWTCLVDGTPPLTTLISCTVVAVSTAVAAAVAGVRRSHLAQLQDRRQAARTLQSAMLTHLPQPRGLQLVSRYTPASSGDQVGGDWYDALVDASGATTLVIGDVMGHDIRAAASMGQVRAVLRAYAVEGGQEPSQIIARTETALDRLGLDVMATVVVARIDRAPGIEEEDDDDGGRPMRLTWSSAGHPPPVLLAPGPSGALRACVLTPDSPASGSGPEPDLMVGVLPGSPRHDHRCTLPPGATLLLHTDGLVERREADLAAGTAALLGELEREGHRPLDDLLDTLLPDLLHGHRDDDVAVLAVRTSGS